MKRKGNILVFTYWPLNDALIQTYTLPYVKIIRNIIDKERKIYLITLENNPNKELTEISPGVFNLQLPYRPLGFSAATGWLIQLFRLARFVRKKDIGVIHAWCTPAGSIAYFLSLITGGELIIDSYEPHAEAMVENGSWKENSAGFRFLFRMEKKMTHYAKHLIACTEEMKVYAERKFKWSGSLHVKPACVDLNKFFPVNIKDERLLEELNLKGKTIGLYAGKFGGIYLEEDVYRFFRESFYEFGNELVFLLLTNEKREKIDEWCSRFALPSDRIRSLFVPHNDVNRYMQLADFAITPVKPIPSKRYCSPIKDGEYWACGLPVVITKEISDDSGIIIGENAGILMDDFTDSGLRRTARSLKHYLLSEGESDRKKRIRLIAEKYRNYDIAINVYMDIYG
ncbi:MAG: hypothetical protein ACK40M_07885 [Flavobacteriales bacterium]